MKYLGRSVSGKNLRGWYVRARIADTEDDEDPEFRAGNLCHQSAALGHDYRVSSPNPDQGCTLGSSAGVTNTVKRKQIRIVKQIVASS